MDHEKVSSIIDHVDMREEAIKFLLAERDETNFKLAKLGHRDNPVEEKRKRVGRPPNSKNKPKEPEA